MSIRHVPGFAELARTPFQDGINALCWERELVGDFGEIIAHCGDEDEVVVLDDDWLRSLSLTAAGRSAVAVLLEDLRLLRALDRDPVLNYIAAYPRDERAGPVATDVFSFHADRAPVEADTWLCTYIGAPSEGLRYDEAVRRVDLAATRAELLQSFGGADDAAFQEYLAEHSYDLHYAPTPEAQPFSFGMGHLWRIAVDWPGSPVPPCIHRAPATQAGQPRLLLIC